MQKNVFWVSLYGLLISGTLLLSPTFIAPAEAAKAAPHPSSASVSNTNTDTTFVEKAHTDNPDEMAIRDLLQSLMAASNHHEMEGIMRYYAPDFMSGDSLSLKDIHGLIQDTWQMFPDIHYESQILEIRINGRWATIESIDTASASAKVDPLISDKPGIMKSRSRGLLYLHKVGKSWEIISDNTIFEKATIVYGPFEKVEVNVEAPEQVFAGESYTAHLKLAIPPGDIAFATLSQDPLTYPQHASKDKFRTLAPDRSDLERIFKANTTSNNEVITATVGFTEIGQIDQEHPTINLRGIVTVVQRVNVAPKSTYKEESPNQQVVHSTADGKIHLEAKPGATTDDEGDMSPDSSEPGPPGNEGPQD